MKINFSFIQKIISHHVRNGYVQTEMGSIQLFDRKPYCIMTIFKYVLAL